MNKPPETIDGAKVLVWAWSGNKSFGLLKYSESNEVAAEIYGLAICRYTDSNVIYRFSCDENWETEQDSDYATIEEAKSNLPEQYKNILAEWVKYD